ncbi:MAG: protein kinase [Lysobacteraceae bacterium]
MIEIAGYKILKTLGRGGMSTVHLALQESVEREVALKVMADTLRGDPEFGARFLREARIAARMKHPHVVQIHDVGISGDHHFIAMEYLPGGPVLTRNGPPREVGFALRVTRQIATALGYAGTRGVVHRDIKPDNILLREDGAAVLTDFGIARASDNTRMTRTGAIIGTPHYMSPEQARGLALDGRADLYSLGVVLYQLLAGQVPYHAEDSLAVGIMHITAPLPRLPAHLSRLQPLLDRMLAKDPAQRFQTGFELAAALEELERNGTVEQGTMMLPRTPAPGVPSTPATVRRMPVASMPSSMSPTISPPIRGTPEGPLLGRMDNLSIEPSRTRIEARSSRMGLWIGVLLALAVLLVGGTWLFQDRLRDLLPQTRMNTLLEQAAGALAQDRLIGDADSARELYAAALAQDPDSLAARQGLQQVGERLLQRARSELARGDAAAARAALQSARELSVPALAADAVRQEIERAEAASIEIESGLVRAREALAQGRLDEENDGAIALFRQVLRADPGNALAASGLRDALSGLLARAQTQAAAGDLETAAQTIAHVESIDAAHLGLPEARTALAQARERASQAQSQQLADRIAQAEDALKRRRYGGPTGAEALFRAVLLADPVNAAAHNGLRRIATAQLTQAQRHIDDYEFEQARVLINQAANVDPDVPGLVATRARLQDIEQRRAGEIAEAPRPASADPSRIAKLLSDASVAVAEGRFLAPPGDCAYDHFRAVLALDPGNAAANAGLSALPERIRQRFENQLSGNHLQSALGQVNALASLSVSDPSLPNMRKRLAGRFLAYAAERIGAGELQRAAKAIDNAAELDPMNSELPAMQARLEQARGK